LFLADVVLFLLSSVLLRFVSGLEVFFISEGLFSEVCLFGSAVVFLVFDLLLLLVFDLSFVGSINIFTALVI